MNNYKKWTGAQREESYRLFCKARDMGLIEAPHKCEICGQTKGILMTHNTNYDVTLSYLPKSYLMAQLTKKRRLKFRRFSSMYVGDAT